MITGTTYLIMTRNSPFMPNFLPPYSTSSTTQSGPTTQPIRIADNMEMNGIMKLLLM